MNDIEAAIGLSQLDTYDEKLDRKRSVANIYREELAAKTVELLPEQEWATDVYHAFPLLHPRADVLAEYLEEQDIGTSRLYQTPLHDYEIARSHTGNYPVAERFAAEVVLLPIHEQVTDFEAKTVANTISSFLRNQ
jgi:dTDP-4-amino-4,6-dideoxygalactose transaminase